MCRKTPNNFHSDLLLLLILNTGMSFGAKCAKRPLANSKVHKMVCIFETRLRGNVSDSGLNYLEQF
jgi:hypothetical protein